MTGLLLDLAFGLACLLVGGLCGAVLVYRRAYRIAHRRGWEQAWESAHVANAAAYMQLTNAELELADIREAEHAAVRDPRHWMNRPYAPGGVFDSPARSGVGPSQQGAFVAE